jgi:beta-glucosidase
MLCTTAPAIDRLHIPVFEGWNQCLRGVQWSEPTTVFPCPINLAATWDIPLVRQVASAISDEARAVYNREGTSMYWPNVRHNGLVYRSPVLNISKDPRWGRIAEVWGEDPYLASRMGVAFVEGLQGDDPRYLKIAATVKHYAAYDQERGREGLNAVVPQRSLMEYWLPPFQAAVEEGHAQSVMAAMNEVNGVPCSANPFLLTTVLRNQWGFDGFAVPDSGGVHLLVANQAYASTMEEAVAKMIKAGIDVDDKYFADLVPRAVQQDLLTEKDVDESLRRVFRVRFRLGEFDPRAQVPYSRISPDIIDGTANRALALKAAQEAIVLLTNRNNLLPLDPAAVKKIAVIGPLANTIMPGAVNYTGKWSRYVVPLDGIKNRAAAGAEVSFAQGCGVMDAPDRQTSFAEAADLAKKADVAIVCVGLSSQIEGETRDRTDINLPALQEDLIRAVYAANPKTVVVLVNGGPVTTPWAGQNVPAMVEMFYDGEEGGNALADVLFGNVNPAGRLPYTVYASLDQIPPQSEYDVTKGFTYLYFSGTPQFAFGHGLSYTQFQYDNLRLSSSEISANGTVNISFDVKNTGSRAGDEVAQLYVHDVKSVVPRPIKQLVGFQRIHLEPGQSATVTLPVSADKLAYYDEARAAFVVEPGPFDVLAGGSSQDIRLKGGFTIN